MCIYLDIYLGIYITYNNPSSIPSTREHGAKNMGLTKNEEKTIRKLIKLGEKSVCITLPIEDIRELGWKEHQKIRVKKIHGGFEIRDWRKQ